MVAMTTTAHRPLNWNLLTIDSRTPEKTARQLEASARAAEAGGRIVALTMPTLVPMNMSFRTHCALFLIPGWGDVMGLPVDRADREAVRPGGAGAARRAGPLRGGRGLPAPVPLGQLHHRRHLRPGERGPTAGATSAPSPRSRARPPSTPCSTWSSPTTSVPSCGPRPPTGTMPPGRPGSRCGTTPGPWWAGRTPAPTSTGCAARTTRPRSSATASASGKLVPLERAVQTDDRGPGRAVRAPRSGPGRRGHVRRPRSSSTPRRWARSRPPWCTTSPAAAPASSPTPTAWCGSWSTAWRPSPTGSPPAASPVPC